MALVVEDDFDTAHAVAEALRWEGFVRAEPVRSAEDALERCATALPTLIVCDIRLPGMSGLELIAELRARYGTAAPPVILLSGHIPPSWQRIAGVAAALRKPCALAALRETVRRVVLASPIRG